MKNSTTVTMKLVTVAVVWNIAGSVDLSNVNCLELIWNNDQKTSDYVIINTKPLVVLITVICLLAEKSVVYILIFICYRHFFHISALVLFQDVNWSSYHLCDVKAKLLLK